MRRDDNFSKHKTALRAIEALFCVDWKK